MTRCSSRPASLFRLLLTLALLAAACGGNDKDEEADEADDPGAVPATDAGSPQSGGTLVYALGAETNSWDPTGGNWSNSGWTVARTIFDTLVMYDENLELRPYLAESVEPNDDFTVWTIGLRDGVEFQNGEPLDADAVKMNIDRHLTSALTSQVFEPVESIEVVDDLTVEVTLDETWVRFPAVLAGQPGIMIAPEMMEDPDGSSNPIGTGPFVLDHWNVDDELVVTRNEDYWNEPAYLEGIDFKIITDHATRALALRNDEFDAATITLAGDLIAFRDDAESEGWQLLTPSGEESEVLFLMNLERPPFDDIRVREALVLATDSQTIIDSLRGGLYERAVGMYPPDSPWYAETSYPDPDPDRARQLVDEYENETGEPIAVTIGAPQEAATLEFVQAVQEQWQAVGIDVEIASLEATEYITSTVTGDFDVNIWQWYSAPNPDSEYPWLHSDFAKPAGQLALNFERIRDDEIDAALEEGRQITDVERRKELYTTVQERMADEFYHVFLYHDFSACVAAPDVHGIMDWAFPDGTPGSGMINIQPVLTRAWIES